MRTYRPLLAGLAVAILLLAGILAQPSAAVHPAQYAPLRILPPEQYAAEIKAMDEDLRALWKASPWK